MSTIRIFSKKAFAIGPGADHNGSIENFITVPGSFQDMPEKYVTDKTFKAACADGNIQIIEKQTSVAKADKIAEGSFEEETATIDPVEKFYEELKLKNRDEVKELASKYGAQFVDDDKLSLNKKRVFEAFKLTVSE